MIRKKLENLKDKFTERANTLFSSMKDEDEGHESSFSNEDTKRKYDEEEYKMIKTRVLEDEKESRRADLLYPTMKDKEEKKEEKLDKIDVKKEEEVKPQKEHSKLTNNASNKEAKRSLKEVDLNDDDYEVSDNTISPKKENINFEKINNVKFPKVTQNDEIENLKKQAKETRKNINDEFIGKLKKFDKALKNNYSINDSIQFTGKNWGNAIGRSDIRNMHINKNGDIELYITDVYDFNEGEKNDLVRVGRNRQDKGEIIPYFYAYRVIISKNEKNEI